MRHGGEALLLPEAVEYEKQNEGFEVIYNAMGGETQLGWRWGKLHTIIGKAREVIESRQSRGRSG